MQRRKQGFQYLQISLANFYLWQFHTWCAATHAGLSNCSTPPAPLLLFWTNWIDPKSKHKIYNFSEVILNVPFELCSHWSIMIICMFTCPCWANNYTLSSVPNASKPPPAEPWARQKTPRRAKPLCVSTRPWNLTPTHIRKEKQSISSQTLIE